MGIRHTKGAKIQRLSTVSNKRGVLQRLRINRRELFRKINREPGRRTGGTLNKILIEEEDCEGIINRRERACSYVVKPGMAKPEERLL